MSGIADDRSHFAQGQFAVDYSSRIDLESLRERRLERARTSMRSLGLDAVLVFKDENVRYLTGLRAQLIAGKTALLNGCLLTVDRGPILLISGGDLSRARVTMPWIDELHAIPILEARGLIDGAVEQTIAPLLHRLDLDEARVGLDECSFATMRSLAATLPDVAWEDGDAALQCARLVKLPEEIALMEEAAAIGEAVTETALRAIAPGVREIEVAAEAMRTLYRLGGEMAHVTTPFVASGEHMSPPTRLATDKIIREGDLVFIDIGAMWNGYFTDLGRTTICGAPSRAQQEVYTAVHDSLEAARLAMVPGNTNDDVTQAVVAAAERHGLSDRFLSLFIGHGIGIGSNEPPYIGESLAGAEVVTLERGMTFAVEPLIWIEDVRGGGGVRLEDTILVDDGGGRTLTRTRFDARLLLD
jgi:Xaa-Pro aminopeptidase